MAKEKNMPTVNVNGCNLYYEIHGQGEPLVMIMGLRRNIEWWYFQLQALSIHFKVIVFDNRGAGRSDKPEMDYSIRLFADDTAGLMDELGISQAHVLGFSMGGYIAQELIINYPEKVKNLALVSTSCGGEKAVLMSEDRMKKFTANTGLTPEEILQKDMDIYFSDEYIEKNPEAIQEFSEISMRYYQPAHAFQRQFTACLNHDTSGRIHGISSPVLIMTGGDDPLVPTKNSYVLKSLLPGANLSVFPKGRHCFFMENSEQFNKEISSYFKS
jgi:pimeloyl-ACP methyl ester carboxylesterase